MKELSPSALLAGLLRGERSEACLLYTSIIHIEKANPDIQGLYQAINQMFLVNEFPEAELVNREDDLGL